MSSNSWENLSDQAIAAAAVVYFLALLATLVEWSALIGRKPAGEVAQASTQAPAHAPADAPAQPVAVGAGGPESPALRSGLSTPDVSVPAGGSGAADDGGDDAEVRAERAALFGRLGYLLTAIGVACHLAACVFRGIAADRVPWGNMYEFTLTGTCVVGLAYVVFAPKYKLGWMAPLAIGFVLCFLMVAVLVLYTPVDPIRQALHSYWLVIHVVAAVLASGAFTLGGMCSVFYLLKAWRPNTTSGWLSRVPQPEVLDRVAYRIHAFAFPIWTFAVLIAGPIWAHSAWGTYWNWDPKEVWAFITWVMYAGYLHARATAGWRGRNAAILALVGMGTLWFNFIGINYFSTTSMHSYAGGAETHSVHAGHATGAAVDGRAQRISELIEAHRSL